MNPQDRTIADCLIEANKALLTLEGIDRKAKNTSASDALQYALAIYLRISPQFEGDPHLRSVLDRIRAHLRFHGEDV